MKRMIALVLSLVMALSLCAPAFAEGEVAAETGTVAEVSDQLELTDALADESVTEVHLEAGDYVADLYNITARNSLTIVGAGDATNLCFANLQVRASQFKELTIKNCAIGRMPNKGWGHLVFGSSTTAGGVYTLSNCTFNGVGSQGIYINQNVPATFNIENCVFNGDFGGEGAITIQNNDGVNLTLNVTDCEFNNIPATSHKIYALYAYDGWTLNVSYTVTFDANDGSTTESKLVPAGEYTLPKCTFTAPTGKQFKGWAASADGDVITDTTYTVTETTTFYAIWEDVVVDVPVTDNENEKTPVKVEATVSGNTATVNKVENLESITSNEVKTDSVTLDFSKVEVTADTPVSTVVIPTQVVNDIKDVVTENNSVDNLEIVTTEATVTFDAAAVETISDNVANNASVSLTVDVEHLPTATDITSANQEAFAEVMEKDGSENAMLLSIELVDEHGNELFSDEPATSGTASVKVKLADGLKSATLYYLDGDEAKYLGSYNADAAGYVTVTLKHFSEYVLLGSTDTVYTGGYYPVVGGTTTTPDADETVTSPKTFDAGVALYVGMSVAAAVGTVTLGKKRED